MQARASKSMTAAQDGFAAAHARICTFLAVICGAPHRSSRVSPAAMDLQAMHLDQHPYEHIGIQWTLLMLSCECVTCTMARSCRDSTAVGAAGVWPLLIRMLNKHGLPERGREDNDCNVAVAQLLQRLQVVLRHAGQCVLPPAHHGDDDAALGSVLIRKLL